MKINDFDGQLWVKRLDMVFDESNVQGIILKENEISEYVNFNKKYLDKINDFIESMKKVGYLFICEPNYVPYKNKSFFDNQVTKAEIILCKINKIEFDKVSVINYGLGDPTRIKDIYKIELINKKDNINFYEINGSDMIRFNYQGSVVDMNGDIIAVSAQKAMDALNKYYN